MITLNGHVIEPTIFPDNTSQVWNIKDFIIVGTNRVVWRFENVAELIHLDQLKLLLDSFGWSADLIIPYLPYARQDKEIHDEYSFALHSFARIINKQHWERVISFDVHNKQVCLDIIENFHNVPPNLDISQEYDIVIFPDEGAANRYKHLIPLNITILIGYKVRDQQTGYISSYSIDADDIAGESILVVDDLCDGGMTFKILGKELTAASEVDLYVSHGIFSKGVVDLLEIYGTIITTDSVYGIHQFESVSQNIEIRKAL